MNFEIKIKNLAEFQRMFKKAPDKVKDEFSAALNKLAVRTQAMAVETARNKKIHSTGNLIQQIKWKKIGQLAYAVISGADYSLFVEEGRKPGKWPPYKPIFEWVQRHYQRFSGFKTKKSKAAQADIKNIAFLIQRKIGRKGIKPRPYMEYTWQKMQKAADEYFEQALNNVVKSL